MKQDPKAEQSKLNPPSSRQPVAPTHLSFANSIYGRFNILYEIYDLFQNMKTKVTIDSKNIRAKQAPSWSPNKRKYLAYSIVITALLGYKLWMTHNSSIEDWQSAPNITREEFDTLVSAKRAQLRKQGIADMAFERFVVDTEKALQDKNLTAEQINTILKVAGMTLRTTTHRELE